MPRKPAARSMITAQNGNPVGLLKGNVFTKTAKKSLHMYRSIGPRGSWGIDYDVLHSLPDTTVIRVEESEERAVYQTNARTWKSHGKIKHFKEGSMDHYTQIFLPVEFFMRASKS